jgi:hypothetical protein
MNNFAQITYTATSWQNAASLTISYPLGTKSYMFDTTAVQEMQVGETIYKSNTPAISFTFGAAQFQILNNTGAAINGEVKFRLALYTREPETPDGATTFLMEFPSRDLFPALGSAGKIYVDTSTNTIYRWNSTQYAFLPGMIDADTAPGDEY